MSPHQVHQKLDLLGVQGHLSDHRGAGIGHRSQEGVTGDSGGISGHSPSTGWTLNARICGIRLHVSIHEWISTRNVEG